MLRGLTRRSARLGEIDERQTPGMVQNPDRAPARNSVARTDAMQSTFMACQSGGSDAMRTHRPA
jgi:hypothetical protein